MIDTLSGSAATRVLGGTEKQLLSLIDRLDRSKVVPMLCLLDGSSQTSRSLEPDCCEVVRLGVRSLHAPSTAVRAWQFGRLLRRERIDVLQVHYPMSTYFAVPIARLAGVRCVVGTRRNLGHWMGRADRLLGRLFSRLMTATLANSQASRDSVIADRCAAPDSVFVVPNGIDLDRFADAAVPSSQPLGGSPRVGVVSNLRPLKNLDVFVRAAASLTESYPDARFLIAGEGQSRSDIQALAEQLGLAERVELLGTVPN
ncbi:MAG: glycosyltransferase, partial [Planctomycetota bacterium]